jgi:hypothetical protein
MELALLARVGKRPIRLRSLISASHQASAAHALRLEIQLRRSRAGKDLFRASKNIFLRRFAGESISKIRAASAAEIRAGF